MGLVTPELPERWDNAQAMVPGAGARQVQKAQRRLTIYGRAEKRSGGSPVHKGRQCTADRPGPRGFQAGSLPVEKQTARQGGPGRHDGHRG